MNELHGKNCLGGRVLVTGGAGFLGSALVHALNARGHRDIVIVDVLGCDEKWRNLVPLRFEDLLDATAFRQRIDRQPDAFGAFSAVFHLGANSSTTEIDARQLADNNYEFSKEIAAWSLARGSRFVYASSAATYGDGTKGMDDRDADLSRLRPLNMYGYSKHLFDLHAQRRGWLDHIVGVKYFNVFGPNEAHKGEMRSLVAKAYEQILATGRVRLFRSHRPDYADGEQKRDFLYVRDAVAMTLHFAEAAPHVGGLFNLGSGEANTWNTLASSIFAALGRPAGIDYVDMPEALRGKYQYHTQAEIGKLRSSGYRRPVTPLVDAVRDYVQNHLVPGKRLGE